MWRRGNKNINGENNGKMKTKRRSINEETSGEMTENRNENKSHQNKNNETSEIMKSKKWRMAMA
jgi:hypothetical protein